MDFGDIDCLGSCGVTLSIAHKAAMQSSLPMLQKNYKFTRVLFFGKILGKASDYLIAVGIRDSYSSAKQFFFWCVHRLALSI